MQALRFSLDDLMTALRGSGVFDITEVQLAVAETNGKVSVYQKAPARPVTCADLQLRPDIKDPPEVLIADGCISREGMAAAGWTDARLQNILRQKQLSAEQVYLLTADAAGLRCLIKKEASA